ncbi:T-cell differentiation antigen CD6-like [Lepisosteus oculatus]|uniref:T-cell differentiation antigen CD6-like n=1 Tax=Lepisosteus oculatus TaxID=7918 RepID=UPI0035F51977
MSALLVSGTGVRLAGGRSLCSGRVEVLRWPSWGTICEADFDMKDAEVVCRQLDCGFPAELLRGAHFGEGQGLIRTEEIQCQGNETRIHDCPTSTREYQSCSHRNDISLACTEYSGYRLVGGPDSCSGRVELQYRDEYRTVCDQYWDLRDATVLCQQLGCGEATVESGCQEERVTVMARWRFTTTAPGGDSSSTPGATERPLWSADSWAVAL